MTGITVANICTSAGHSSYVGRRTRNRPGSPLGNPHPIAPQKCRLCNTYHARAEAIPLYVAWLDEQLAAGPGNPAHDEIHRLAQIAAGGNGGEPLRLACWCSPLPCHADVIRAAILRVLEQQPAAAPAA